MKDTIAVVDLFSGPGGLGEGFHACGSKNIKYEIVLSVENEPAAYATLLLRSFLRKFAKGFPQEYYDFLNNQPETEPDWKKLYPTEWEAAEEETMQLKIGKSSTNEILEEKIKEIRASYKRTILIGGPPCQRYSLVGRSRVTGMNRHKLGQDRRLKLYLDYVKVLSQLKPEVAVMENVKGMLSFKRRKKSIFDEIRQELCDAGYRLFALSPEASCVPEKNKAKDFIVQSEQYGIPQARHRVIIVALRNDIAKKIPEKLFPRLKQASNKMTLKKILDKMPKLRSGLSKSDSLEKWRDAMLDACNLVAEAKAGIKHGKKRIFQTEIRRVEKSLENHGISSRKKEHGTTLSSSCPTRLRKWICDNNIENLPNNETRGHMPEDLARYLFAAIYGRTFKESPKAPDFPGILAPRHKNWKSGKFSDRFRVQLAGRPATTITSHISKDGHYFIHHDPCQCRSLTVREAARIQTFPDNYFFKGNRTQQYVQVGNAVPPFLALQIAEAIQQIFEYCSRNKT